MRAFIAHGEADQAIADELKDYLKPLGLFAETEFGARGFHHLQKSDVVIALWSRNALFTSHRMMLEKRMLDAWADGQLVLVKLDHNFFPVGMRDLPYIDATFETARKTMAWRDVARQAKEAMNRLLVEQQRPASPSPGSAAPPAAGAPSLEDGISALRTEHGEMAETPDTDAERERMSRLRTAKRRLARAEAPDASATHTKRGSNWLLVLFTVLLTVALVAVGANVLLQRIGEPHENAPIAGTDTPADVVVQDARVTADFLALLQNADVANGAVEAAKCQVCHSFDVGGPVLLGPPLYNLIGRDIASHEGFAYSNGGAGLADAEGVWTFRNLNQYLERPKSVAPDTTMIFAGIPRETARADLIAYLRTLTPGEPAPLPEALPPGVALDTGAAANDGAVTPPPEIIPAETAADSAMRQLREISDDVLRQPLLLGGTTLVLLALMLFVAGLSMAGRRKSRASAQSPPPVAEPEAVAPEALEEALGAIAAGADDAVFISYAHDDNDRVQPVVTIVKSNGREVWIDKGGIQAGEGWAGEIVRAIKAAGGVMVMCSQRAFESDHIKREIYLADRYKKPLLPIFLEPAQPPEDFEYFFAGVQWLELFKLPEADRAGAIGRALAGV